MRFLALAVLLAVTLAGCGGAAVDASGVPELPGVTAAELTATLAESAQPVVLNVWASWCIPCRSEAPLLSAAAIAYGDSVTFLGLDVRDSQEGARGFIAEFYADAGITYLFDPGGDIPLALGGSKAVPLTFFYAPGGELVKLHSGVIDERTLALEIDEILGR
jgi:cytochrome c biogenesis protein CcmG/thiol:disulfide interchange protein DsbE